MRAPAAAALILVTAAVLFVLFVSVSHHSVSTSLQYVSAYTEKVGRSRPTSLDATTGQAPENGIVEINTKESLFASPQVSKTRRRYREGRTVIHDSMYSCQRPDFLSEYKSPCWRKSRDSSQIVCAARVMLLGFHKCGTSDLSKWFFKAKSSYASSNLDYFVNEKTSENRLTTICPKEYIEDTAITHIGEEISQNTTIYVDCPGCAIIAKILSFDHAQVVMQSSVQYLHKFMRDNSRYIITMRNPTDRVLSHFFYAFKTNSIPNYELFSNKSSPEEVGFKALHDVAVSSVDTLHQCLKERGTTDCILTKLSSEYHKDIQMVSFIRQSCYSTFLREVLKFLPKEKIYFSRMEDYSTQPEKVVKEIFNFIGDLNYEIDTKLIQYKRNVGVTSKPVLQETIDLLDQFFVPFNEELAEMLGDSKWKFHRETNSPNK